MRSTDRLTAFRDALKRAADLRDEMKSQGIIVTDEGIASLLSEMANSATVGQIGEVGDELPPFRNGEPRPFFERIKAAMAQKGAAATPREIAEVMVQILPEHELPTRDPGELRPRVGTELARIERVSKKAGRASPVRRVGKKGRWELSLASPVSRVRLNESERENP